MRQTGRLYIYINNICVWESLEEYRPFNCSQNGWMYLLDGQTKDGLIIASRLPWLSSVCAQCHLLRAMLENQTHLGTANYSQSCFVLVSHALSSLYFSRRFVRPLTELYIVIQLIGQHLFCKQNQQLSSTIPHLHKHTAQTKYWTLNNSTAEPHTENQNLRLCIWWCIISTGCNNDNAGGLLEMLAIRLWHMWAMNY